MSRRLRPARSIQGSLRLPGDKSISHRCAMLAAVADGRSVLTNYSNGDDCASTLGCLSDLGATISRRENVVEIEGVGLSGLRQPQRRLDAGNSGSTIRMLSGILAGQPFETEIGGDESLSRRPMRRIMAPLSEMGAQIEAREGEFPPLKIRGGRLRGVTYRPPVASAQVKTATLFAGLYADGRTRVEEPVATRNHTELALRLFGADVRVDNEGVEVAGGGPLRGQKIDIPSDLSAATFFLAAALAAPLSELRLEGVGLNASRTALLDLLRSMGASIEVQPEKTAPDEEPRGLLIVRGPQSAGEPPITGGVIAGATTAAVIDEIPALAVLGALSRDGLEIRDASELRVKESDRIAAIADNLVRLGGRAEAFANGLRIPGGQSFHGARLDSFGDHRIAMAFAVAALRADGGCQMEGAEATNVSFPDFFDLLDSVTEYA